MSQFHIKTWIVGSEVVSVFCHPQPITQAPITIDGATVIDAVCIGDYIHASELFPTLVYSNGVLSSPLCEITTETPA
jgi:hypothetical protein